MNPRICYVVNSVSETSVPATLATALVDYEGLDVDILAWFETDSFAGEERVGVKCLDASRPVGLSTRTVRDARQLLQQYDVIQANTSHAGSFAKAIGYSLDIPLVSREGNVRDGFTTKGHIVNGVTNGLVDRIVPNSRAVYDSFSRWERYPIDEGDVEIIPNGVDLELIDRAPAYGLRKKFSIPGDSIVVGTTAVISEQKAHDTLVRAVAEANDRTDQRIELVIVGNGPKRKEVEQLSTHLGIEEQIYITGIVDRETVYSVLGEIDIYAMPSRWEGFANAAVEALGAGVPSIFSDIDPFVLPYRNVALFHRLDDVDDLASRIVELADDAELRSFYSERGRQLVETEYTLEQVASKYVDVYEQIT